MEIRTDSWHYRLLKFMGSTIVHAHGYRPVTLCEYFWSLMLHLFLAVVAVVVLSFEAAMMVSFVLLLLDAISLDSGNPLHPLILTMGTVGWMACLGALLFFAIRSYLNLCRKYDKRTIFEIAGDGLSKWAKCPTLFKEYWKAHKEKYCPVIDFVDKKD